MRSIGFGPVWQVAKTRAGENNSNLDRQGRKINRCLAEGRERFRRLISRSEDGRRCAEMRPVEARLDRPDQPRGLWALTDEGTKAAAAIRRCVSSRSASRRKPRRPAQTALGRRGHVERWKKRRRINWQ